MPQKIVIKLIPVFSVVQIFGCFQSFYPLLSYPSMVGALRLLELVLLLHSRVSDILSSQRAYLFGLHYPFNSEVSDLTTVFFCFGRLCDERATFFKDSRSRINGKEFHVKNLGVVLSRTRFCWGEKFYIANALPLSYPVPACFQLFLLDLFVELNI